MGRPRAWAVMLMLATAGFAGCDRAQPVDPDAPASATPSAGAATAPAVPATNAASKPAASQPASSVMNVGGHTTVFPPARLRLENDGRNLVALLFSDDPRDALKDNYTGNSFYLRMELDVDSPEKLADATWRYTTPSASDREDSPYGIYLGGRKLQLAPFQVLGKFRVDAPAASADAAATPTVTNVLISGQFQVVDDAARRGPPQVVIVAADLPVRVDAAAAKKPGESD